MGTIPTVLEIPIGEVVKAWREHHGLSVTEFAKRAGIPKAYVSELEHLKIDTPGPERMGQLAAGLRVGYWDLVQRRMPGVEQDQEDAGRQGEDANGLPVRLGLARPAMRMETTGDRIDVLIAAAELTKEEQVQFGERLIAVTKELLALWKAARR
jgi:transcriptional regulator with XRE-family HTH domain